MLWRRILTVMLSAAIWCSTAQAQTVKSRVATGAGHGIGLKSNGSVWTWGGNPYGQPASAAGHAALPVRLPGLSGIRDVTAGDGFSLAVQNNGLVWAWGGNEYGVGATTLCASIRPFPCRSPDSAA
jgi:alpha-tubulin suppressor-like RCC1 family protein